jgi:signal transduction histidine kinase
LDDAAGLRARQLAALSHHLIQLAEIEKATLARQLHDEFGACLTVIALDILIVAEKIKHTEPDLALRLQRAIARINEAVVLKRRLVEELRPSMLDSLGLSACLTEHMLEFEKRTGLHVTTDICPDFDNIDADNAIAVFRIAQESLRNVEKHAAASRLWISLQPKDGGACLLIEDNGIGIASDVMMAPKSHGLSGMRERMILHGGKLNVGRGHQGNGTTVEAWFPPPR